MKNLGKCLGILTILSLICGLTLAHLPRIGLFLLGFEPENRLTDYWRTETQTPPASPLPITPTVLYPPPQVATLTPPPPATPTAEMSTQTATLITTATAIATATATPVSLRVFSPGRLDLQLSLEEVGAVTVSLGTLAGSQRVVLLDYDEAAFEALCALVTICQQSERYRLTHVDFRPGGLVAYGEFQLGDVWSGEIWSDEMGVLIRQNGLRFQAAGVVLGDDVYKFPADSAIQAQVADVSERGNATLQTLTLHFEGEVFTLSQLVITDEAVRVVFVGRGR